MSRILLTALAAGAAALLATAALADPPITTRPGDAPPSGPDPAAWPIGGDGPGTRASDGGPEEDWARGPGPGRPPSGCAPVRDPSPHGEVWAGASSRGYGDVGGVVTGPLGPCGSATLAIDVGGRR